MSDAPPYTPWTLSASGDATDPVDLRTVSDSIVMICDVVSGSPTYVVEVSNDERTTRRYTQVGSSYTTSIVKRLRGAMPRFVRARMTSGSGQVDVGFGKGLNADGKLSEANDESRHS